MLSVLLVFYAGVFAWLQTDSARQIFLRLVISAVENNFEATCRIESISGKITKDLELRGIVLQPESGGSPLLTADRMRISMVLFPLLSKTIWIPVLEITGVRVNLEKVNDQKWNYQTLLPDHRPQKRSWADLFTIDIRQIIISDASISIRPQAQTPDTPERTAIFECRASLSAGRQISVDIKQLAFQMDDPHVVLTNGAGRVRFDTDTGEIEIQHARLSGEQSTIEFDGRVMTAGKMSFTDLRSTRMAISLPEIGRALGYGIADTGIVTGEIAVTGMFDDLNFRAALELGTSQLQAEGVIGIDDRWAVALDITGRLKNVDPTVIPVPGFDDFVGNVNAEVAVNGQYFHEDGFSGNVDIDLGPSRLAGYDIGNASVRSVVRGADLLVEQFYIDTPYGRAEGRAEGWGILSTDIDRRVDLTLTAGNVNPARFFNKDDISGDINFILRSEITLPGGGAFNRTSGRIHVRFLPSTIMDFDVHDGNIEASWLEDQITLDRFALEGNAGTLTASGNGAVRDLSYRGTVTATLLDLKTMAPIIRQYTDDHGLSGSAAVKAVLEGRGMMADVIAEIRAADVMFRDISAAGLDIDGHWQGVLEDFTLSAVLHGWDVRYDEVRISSLDMTSLWSSTAADIDLTINAASGEALAMSAGVHDWMGPVREIRLNRVMFTSDGLPPLVSEHPVQITISADSAVIESLKLISSKASLEAGGTFGFARPNKLSAEFMLQNLDLQMILGFFEGGHKVEGSVNAHLALSGFADDPVVNLSASIDEGKYKDFRISEARIRSTYQSDKAHMEISVFGSGGKLMDAYGSVSCRLALYPFGFSFGPESVVLSVTVDDLPVSDLAAFWDTAGDMSGRISGHINLSGWTDQPVIDASAALSDFTYRKFHLSNAMMTGAYQDENMRFQATGFMGERKVADIGGSVPMRLSLSPFTYEPRPDGMRVAVAVDDFDISVIDDMIRHPEYGISGIVQLAAEVGGTVNRPLVKGRLALREGSLRIKPQRLFYSRLEADLKFGPDTIEIEEILIAEDAGGHLSLKGVIHHDQFVPGVFDIRAVGTDIQIPFHAGVSGGMSPDLRFEGTWDAPVVKGDVRISRGRVNLDVLFSRQPSEIKVIQPMADDNGVFRISDETPSALAFVEPLRADVTITVPGNVWLRGKDESIEIRGKVHVEKEPGRPFIVHGPLSAVRGTYQFRGKLFKITRGELNFIGQEIIDPPLDIQAETRIGDVLIIIHLTGTYEKQTIRFDSIPPMDEVDIISYLIFGRPQTALTEGESFRAGEAALALTGQIAADELRDILGDRFHIDYINISAGSGGFQHGSLSMGKYLTPRVFVIYRQTFSSEDPQQVEVYYEIDRNFSLETQINDEKTLAVDLIWKYEF